MVPKTFSNTDIYETEPPQCIRRMSVQHKLMKVNTKAKEAGSQLPPHSYPLSKSSSLVTSACFILNSKP